MSIRRWGTTVSDGNGKRCLNGWVISTVLLVAVVAIVWYLWFRVHPSLEATKVATDFLARMAWPFVGVLALIFLRGPLVSLVRDLARFKFSAGGLSVEGERRTYDGKLGNELAESVKESLPASTQELGAPSTGETADGASLDQARPVEDAAAEVLLDASPNMAMFDAFIKLERDARTYFRDFVPSDEDERRPGRPVSLSRIISCLDPAMQKLFTYLNRVRNGIAHGEAPGYTKAEARTYRANCELARAAIGQRATWRFD